LAFLFGVFRARPSPFDLMDEVEAELDDVKPPRFSDLVPRVSARGRAHRVAPERTMEAADASRACDMQPGGSSRCREPAVNDD